MALRSAGKGTDDSVDAKEPPSTITTPPIQSYNMDAMLAFFIQDKKDEKKIREQEKKEQKQLRDQERKDQQERDRILEDQRVQDKRDEAERIEKLITSLANSTITR